MVRVAENDRGSVLAMLLSGITTLGKTVLIVVAVTFIAWALITAIFVPKRHPVFPRRLDAFLARLRGALRRADVRRPLGDGHAGDRGGGTRLRDRRERRGEGAGPAGDAAAGKALFASAGCGACHALADANAGGAVGPSLDEAKPSAELVVERVTNGMGAMPSFSDELTEAQIADIAAYVVSATGT